MIWFSRGYSFHYAPLFLIIFPSGQGCRLPSLRELIDYLLTYPGMKDLMDILVPYVRGGRQ